MDALSADTTEVLNYLEDKKTNYPNFRSSVTGYSYEDLYDIYKMLYDYEIPSLYANVMTGPQVRNADKLCRNLTQSIESSVQNEQVYQEREAYLSGLIRNYSEKNRDLINYHYHNDANDSGTDYILKNVEAYDDNQSKQITYDSLILEYVEIDKTLRSSAIRRAYTQQLLDTFQAAGGVGGDEASHAAIESEINKYEQTLVDYYQIVNQTSMEHNRSLSADYLQTTSSTRVWPSINTKLYLAIGFVFFFLVGCALAVVVGRSRDFVEYFMYVDKKTGLPNRDRVDAMMARLEKQGLLPSHFTCMYFQFTSLNHLSREYGYSVGNHVLRDFAGLVAALGTEESFIGSNGAGQIVGFFRECNAVKAEAILEVLDEQIQEYNSLNPDYAIEYRAASATSDDEKEFNIRDLLRCAFKEAAVMLQNQRACQLVRSKTGCEPLALAVAWGARTAGRCAAGVLGAVKYQRFSDQQLETFAARAPGICPKPVCDAGEPCLLPPQDDAVDVSVIVPVHNGERFLRACLDSILHQNTTRRLQVLAVEDGSTDGSGAILAEYARQGGVTVLHPEQGGSAARARNTGLARAVGRWVLFVDCDDCLLPDAVETLLAAQARTGADIVQGGWQYCDEADTRGAVQQYAEACYTGPRRLDVVELPGTPWGKLYRRTLFERVRFPSGYTCFEDAMIHFWVFPRAKCIASTKPVVYLWRKNTMGLTATSQNTAKALQAYWVAE